jgi:hypothetical protein
MENHSQHSSCGELLAHGKVARADAFPCGHIVLTFENFKVGFAAEDFRDFVHTVSLAFGNLKSREIERAEWGLFM